MVKIPNNQKGFTLIEIAAVIGVLAVTSAILIVNNRLSEFQLGLSKDSALIASTVSRAKSMALQNSAEAEVYGYGVKFESVGLDKNNLFIFKDKNDNGYYNNGDGIVGSKINLSPGIIFDNNYTSSITDLVFYSSDANVKLYRIVGDTASLISPAGVVIIKTNSGPTLWTTLKITITGQVTVKNGKYTTIENFNAGDDESDNPISVNYLNPEEKIASRNTCLSSNIFGFICVEQSDGSWESVIDYENEGGVGGSTPDGPGGSDNPIGCLDPVGTNCPANPTCDDKDTCGNFCKLDRSACTVINIIINNIFPGSTTKY